MNNTHPTTNHNDEIDLFELCITLWQNKWTIIGITSVCTIIALIIAFLVIKPSYQSETVITPPFTYQIDALNDGVLNVPANQDKETRLPTLAAVDAEQVYSAMINSLYSTNLQREFFKNNYIPKQTDNIEITQTNFASFQKKILIKQTNKEQNYYSISFTTEDPHESYELMTEFLNLANLTAKDIILKNRKAEIQSLSNNIQNAITGLKSELTSTYNNELASLQNAYEIAEKLQLTKPKELITEAYMQGTEVLASRISFLTQQKSNFSHNAQYNELTANLNMYQNITLPTAEQFNTHNVDATAFIPEKPIKPNKKLIVIIGFLLGGMFAVMFVLIRQAIRVRLGNQS